MDSGYFCGYKIDCKGHISDFLKYDSDEHEQLRGLEVDGLPGKSWMYYEGKDNNITFLCMEKKGIPSDYRCPIFRDELIGRKGGLRQVPKPLEFSQHIEQLKSDPLWEYCKKKYGEDDVILRWGSLLLIW
ncbi:MAG: hypothetical protein IMZ64_05255 [Bacteroidetes bacterium]|nr:hypothetical protein [Bacteroidota bacterium]